MKSKILLLLPLALLALSAAPVKASTTSYLEAEIELTEMTLVRTTKEGYLYYVPFAGVAGGPNIIAGTIEGVDHLLQDWEGIYHVDAYLTITDYEGDKISAHMTGPWPSYTMFFENGQATVIDKHGYPTTGKYVGLVDTTFRVEGLLADFSRIHFVWYWT